MKNSVKYLYIIVFCLLPMGRVIAQNADTLIYVSKSVRSVGCGFPALNYSLLSPLIHTGYSANFHSTRFNEKPKHLSQLQIHSKFGFLYNNANDSYITSLGVNGGWSRHWFVSDRERPLRILIGAGADIGMDVSMKDDNTNNPMAYFFNISLSPDILFKYRFKINEIKFELGQQIDIPVVSLISSSDYSASLPLGIAEEEASFFDAMRLTVLFGSLKKCVTITTLDVKPSSGKYPVFRISYIFSGMNYNNEAFTVKSADNILLFGIIFNLFR